MSTPTDQNEPLSASQAVLNGAFQRCPRCGEGKLFRSYLKPNDACDCCHEPLSDLRADDGPAWLTVLLTGHIVVLTILHMEHAGYDSMALEMTVAIVATLLLALLILPISKGVFIGALWFFRERDKEVE